MKSITAALGTSALLSLGLVAAGCGDGNTAGSAGGTTTQADRQAGTPVGERTNLYYPRCGELARPNIDDTPERLTWQSRDGIKKGFIYINCSTEPITLSVDQVDPYDWMSNKQRPNVVNGTVVQPRRFHIARSPCNSNARSSKFRLKVGFPDGSKASVRVHLAQPCSSTSDSTTWVTFGGDVKRNVLVTSSTGKQVEFRAPANTWFPNLSLPERGKWAMYAPVAIFSPPGTR